MVGRALGRPLRDPGDRTTDRSRTGRRPHPVGRRRARGDPGRLAHPRGRPLPPADDRPLPDGAEPRGRPRGGAHPHRGRPVRLRVQVERAESRPVPPVCHRPGRQHLGTSAVPGRTAPPRVRARGVPGLGAPGRASMAGLVHDRRSLTTRRLGADGPALPVVGSGTWRVFDVGEDRQPEVDATVEAAWAAGTRVFDSSPMYGQAEARLGAALRDRRDEAFVATKLWTPDAAEAARQLDRQLQWFGGRIDLLQVHNLVGWPARLHRIEQQRDAGRGRHVGAAHYLPSAFDELERVMRTRRLDAIQVPLDPRERAAETRILPLAADLGLGVLVMRPFGEGSLLGRPFPRELSEAGLTGWPEALLRW